MEALGTNVWLTGYFSQCVCGVQEPLRSASLHIANERYCDTRCAGEASETCGGDGFVSVGPDVMALYISLLTFCCNQVYSVKPQTTSASLQVVKPPQSISPDGFYTKLIALARRLSYWCFTAWAGTLVVQLYDGVWRFSIWCIALRLVHATATILLSTFYLDGVWGLGPGYLREVRALARSFFEVCIGALMLQSLPEHRDIFPQGLQTVRWKLWGVISFIATVLLTRLVDEVWGLGLD